MSDLRTREECLKDIEDAHTRLSQLRQLDTWVYAIARTWKGGTRYHTRVPEMGWRQLLATDLNHSAIWLTASRHWAKEVMRCMATAHPLKGAKYEIIRVSKEALPHLPCWKYYKHREEFNVSLD